MLETSVPLLLVFVIAVGLAAVIVLLSNFLGPRRATAIKREAFEGGNPTSGPPLDRFNVKFYLVAILFLVFDVEAVFIYPWAVVFHDSVVNVGPVPAIQAALAMLSFVGIVLVGLIYTWQRGALDWSQNRYG